MRTRATKLSVIGAAVGLVLAGAAIVPASAAPPSGGTTTTVSSSCGAYNGLTGTGSTFSTNGIGLRGGDVITAKVSPARDGDRITLSGANGLSFFFTDAAATTGLTFRAPADGVYSLGWSLLAVGEAPSSVSWSFTATCSTNPIVTTPTSPTKPGKGKGKG